MPSTNNNADTISRRSCSSWPSFFNFSLSLLVPLVAASVIFFQLDPFDPAPMPIHELTRPPANVLTKNAHILKGSEFLGKGELLGPEDIAFDSKSGLIYTSCAGGWIKRVTVNDSVTDSVVENWVNTGGRPLGLALGHGNEVLAADAFEGLLKINGDGGIELLTNEAEGIKFKLTDGVDIAEDGTIYFTDASYKYDLHDFMWDILEGKPYGRLMSFDPATKETKVLVRDLHFANGVAVSPNQEFVVFCETPMRRCRKYYIQGNKKGQIENFISLPGAPDNIHSDGHGHFWIALSSGNSAFVDLVYRYPFIRKFMAISIRFKGPVYSGNNAGLYVVDLEGNPIAHYYDHNLRMTSSGVRIGDHIYCGSIEAPYILRLNPTSI
ncbi:protein STRICTOSIDINE SYNTHASE-LIKE 5 [Ricinus communis]|uniref:protein STRICTOSIDINE SYNTHASE-LIKE 5 n=1 Tax=Ricinus communis TaxID=3988 RepID=UPI00201ADE67|nr:protein STRICTOSIDINE SYNTHASE-LIKE 5 [Ricinus communis]